jgi:hypothetical protein
LSFYEGVGVGVLKIKESESEVLKIEESEWELLCTDFTALVFISEVESVYSAVRPESLYKTDTLRL